jgi:hypothetical protein
MGMEGRATRVSKVLAALERWAWRVLIFFLVLAVLIAVFLLVGLGTGGSGSS